MSEDASVQVEEHKGFCNHWSSYRLSLRQTWRELKLPTRSSINWMIDIFANTSTDPKADFTFCLNAGFYLEIFNQALVYAVLYPVLIILTYLQAKTTPVSNADLEEGDELEGTELYIKTNVGFAEAVWGMGTDNLVTFLDLVSTYGLFRGAYCAWCYLLYSGVLMSKNRCVVCCTNMYLLLHLVSRGVDVIGLLVLEDPDENKDLQSVLSKETPFDNSLTNAHRVICRALCARWTRILLDFMMIKCAFHLRFNGETTSETESLLQDKHEL